MVTLNRIYTKTGDKGETALGDGTRLPKHALRIAAYGTIDEANAAIGIARLHSEGEIDAMLGRIQNDLFDLGADLCVPETAKRSEGRLRIADSQVERLEREIDGMNASLAPLNSFVLPGGTPAAAQLHLARAIVRRGARLIGERRAPGRVKITVKGRPTSEAASDDFPLSIVFAFGDNGDSQLGRCLETGFQAGECRQASASTLCKH